MVPASFPRSDAASQLECLVSAAGEEVASASLCHTGTHLLVYSRCLWWDAGWVWLKKPFWWDFHGVVPVTSTELALQALLHVAWQKTSCCNSQHSWNCRGTSLVSRCVFVCEFWKSERSLTIGWAVCPCKRGRYPAVASVTADYVGLNLKDRCDVRACDYRCSWSAWSCKAWGAGG